MGTGQWLVRCAACAGLYLTPTPTPATLAEFYRVRYRQLYLTEAADRYDEAFLTAIAARPIADRRVALLQAQLPTGGRVLEVGCGHGAFLGRLAARRPDAVLHASEPDRAIAGVAFDGAAVTLLPDDQLEAGAPYDLIVLFHVLEHLPDPAEALARLRGLLGPGGRIAIEVPDAMAPWAGGWREVHPAHLSYFTGGSLGRLLARAGLPEFAGGTPGPPATDDVLWRVVVAAEPVEAEAASAAEIAALDRRIPTPPTGVRPVLGRLARAGAVALLGRNRAGSLARHRAYRVLRRRAARQWDDGHPRRVTVLGVEVDPMTMSETLWHARRAMREGRPLTHADLNVAKLVMMRDDPALAAAVTAADLVSVDGMGIVFGARLLGQPIADRVAGVDLMERLVAAAAEDGRRPYLLGASPEVVATLAAKLVERNPTLRLAGADHGYFSDVEEPAVVERVRRAQADCLFVGMPTPRKEIFIDHHRGELDVAFAMGVGGAFDVLSGHLRRAPRWAQRSGLEWLFRLVQEPRRLGPRYLRTNARFLGLILRALMFRR